ncbi:hypothetical protein A0H81_04708 [Grifola frondosa]|uniref:Uncharacterized protein n=1 Tax=Grifola frondosa TaxID=5627 RepID=A0A1C7MF05_GRIFR|nr:hypothetical protein A0H81_04708 [Grifola frondosa]
MLVRNCGCVCDSMLVTGTCPRSFCAVCSTRPTVPFLRRRLYLLGKHSACSTSSRHHASVLVRFPRSTTPDALRTVHYLPSGMHTASAAPATFISSARLRCPTGLRPTVRINELLGHLLTIFIFIFPTARLSFLVRSCNFVSGL